MQDDLLSQHQGIRLDTSNWPILALTPTDNASDQSIQDFMGEFFDMLMAKKERYALIVDLRKRTNMSRKQRKLMSDELNKHKEFAEEYNAGTALIVNSGVMRGIMMSVFWLFNPKHPTDVFKTTEDAFAWANSQLNPATRVPRSGQGA
ncbi:MAG: hypothetical protein GY762_03755 [Proteobacteria bacterium]|nr:hypothetical protein [Pseudomonadota bacterium]